MSKLNFLSSENCAFTNGESGELSLHFENRIYTDISFHIAFPYISHDSYISVTQDNVGEIGIIKSLSDFDADSRVLIEKQLDEKYFCPVITKINKIRDRFGYSYWCVLTDKGECEFIVLEDNRSIIKITEVQFLIVDNNGNRYVINDFNSLDNASIKHAKAYL